MITGNLCESFYPNTFPVATQINVSPDTNRKLVSAPIVDEDERAGNEIEVQPSTANGICFFISVLLLLEFYFE